MQPESLVQLVGSGNVATVEEEWMKVVESAQPPLGRLADYQVVLAELKKQGRSSQAESLAWTALESLSARHQPSELLKVAGPFLLSLGDSEELRKQVCEMYRAAYAGVEGLDALLRESGIAGGRPVRRALRTLETCLAVQEGGFLCARDEDRVAQVLHIDRGTWEFTLRIASEEEVLGAVLLSDAYGPAEAADIRVMRHVAPDELQRRLDRDPAEIVLDFCRRRGGKMDSLDLESELVPSVLSAAAWKKWWPRARAALKLNPNVTLEGRSNVTITLESGAQTHEDSFLKEFGTLRDPHDQLAAVQRYVRESADRGAAACVRTLRQCYEQLVEKARRLTQQRAAAAGVHWFVALRIGQLAGLDAPRDPALAFVRDHPQIAPLFQHLNDEELLREACGCLREVRPESWKSELWGLLPRLSTASCAVVADFLQEAGVSPEEFAPVAQRILAAPLDHFDALLWLWNDSGREDSINDQPLVTLLLRILRTLEDARRSDSVARDRVKECSARARAVLSARRYERFVECLKSLEPSMALTIKTHLGRGETLGRAVREDMLKLISQQFPSFEAREHVPLWKQENVLYVTRPGLLRKQEEIEHHINVKMKENARAIGRAAELGDLSENSEYKFALEERDLLRARLAQMNAELEMAKVIGSDDVPTDEIGVGTRAVFQRVSDGRRYELTFVGPWEADIERGLINYRAPLAQKLMGRRIGDVVDFDHGSEAGAYRVVELHNGLHET